LPSRKTGNQCKKRKGRPKPALIHKRRVNEKVYVEYHESLSSQAKSSRTYLLHKTMGARIIAKEEQPDCHKIDRSGVVSKYVGETEKNLSQIFLKVEPNYLMLFFDEADGLIGKR
jgi:hypothetical protein